MIICFRLFIRINSFKFTEDAVSIGSICSLETTSAPSFLVLHSKHDFKGSHDFWAGTLGRNVRVGSVPACRPIVWFWRILYLFKILNFHLSLLVGLGYSDTPINCVMQLYTIKGLLIPGRFTTKRLWEVLLKTPFWRTKYLAPNKFEDGERRMKRFQVLPTGSPQIDHSSDWASEGKNYEHDTDEFRRIVPWHEGILGEQQLDGIIYS